MTPRMRPRAKFTFLLYVAGDTQNSVLAVANLKALCQTHLAGRHEIQIVDVFKEPGRALADRIFMTPTLIRLTPQPVRRIVGTLSQVGHLLQALGLEPLAA
jgi:circadian clock protein KaiB